MNLSGKEVWGRSGRRDPLVCTAVARQLGPWAWRGFGQVPWVHAARGQSSAAQQRLLGPLRHAAAEAAHRPAWAVLCAASSSVRAAAGASGSSAI
ncbi:hypothetical protein PVAP13_5NG208481 [Panicum virgatum]|uniref:Uncharacterized protein n=1 Tax=Panicum virgatum TaxID=38727 RepID=A0A8T0RS17_PANVG|nr:hypothetical protein PVAP13_5NG208481 [Panicum virgatum]